MLSASSAFPVDENIRARDIPKEIDRVRQRHLRKLNRRQPMIEQRLNRLIFLAHAAVSHLRVAKSGYVRPIFREPINILIRNLCFIRLVEGCLFEVVIKLLAIMPLLLNDRLVLDKLPNPQRIVILRINRQDLIQYAQCSRIILLLNLRPRQLDVSRHVPVPAIQIVLLRPILFIGDVRGPISC